MKNENMDFKYFKVIWFSVLSVFAFGLFLDFVSKNIEVFKSLF